MNTAKIVMHVVNRERCDVILNLFAERVREARETSNAHPHREVLALHVARGNVFFVRVADLRFLLATNALRKAVANFSRLARTAAVKLHQNRVINVYIEVGIDSAQIKPVAVRGQLDSVSQAATEIGNELAGSGPIAPSHLPRTNQLGIGIHRDPSPAITRAWIALAKLGRHIPFFGCNEAPNFVALNSLTFQIGKRLVHVVRTGRAKLNQKLRNGVLGDSGHANRGANRVAFHQSANHLYLLSLV